MTYFLTVANHQGDYLHRNEPYPDLDPLLAQFSRHYLKDPDFPRYWSGSFAIRDGRISRLLIRKSAHTGQVRENIDYIYIANDQALREITEHDPAITSSI